ncbi:MAG: Zinc finger, CCHC domain-containing protein, partial [Pleopsidium flavum]
MDEYLTVKNRAAQHFISPALERWPADSVPEEAGRSIPSIDPHESSPPAVASYLHKVPEQLTRTIPPSFEQQVAAEGWPRQGQTTFSARKGLSEAELRDLVRVLLWRGDQMLESTKQRITAQTDCSSSLAKKPLEGHNLPSIMEPVTLGKMTAGAACDPRLEESKKPHVKASDLDSHLRNLILANGTPPAQATSINQNTYTFNSQQHSHHQPPMQRAALGDPQEYATIHDRRQTSQPLLPQVSGQVSTSSPPRKRPNQAQRRQMQSQRDVPIVQSPSASHENAHLYRNQAPQSKLPSASPRGLQTQSQSHHRAAVDQQYHQTPQRQLSAGFLGHQPPGMQSGHDFQPRPPPRYQRLYEPGPYGSNAYLQQQRGQRPIQASWANFNAQAQWLNQVARDEIAKAEISFAELQEKENLRLVLEVVCREVITEFERSRDPSFDPGSVALKSFGSLSSGFATHSSDMDLALVSPKSRPDSASADSAIPRLLEKKFLDLGHGARLLTKTRVPIIKFCEKPTPELLEILQQERSKWEEDKAISPQKEQLSLPDDQQLSKANTEPSGIEASPSATVSSMSTKGSVEGNEKYSMEELVRMYEMAINDGWYNDLERDLIRQFAQQVQQHGADPNSPELAVARLRLDRLPDVLRRYRTRHGVSPARLEFPKTGIGIQCDVNFSNHLALHNTLLLRCYCHCDPRVRDMVLFVKAWAKRRKINSAYHGTLSSYGYVLMVLHYLVNVTIPPVVPNLQLAWKPPKQGSRSGSLEETNVDGYDVRFWRSEMEIKKLAASGLLTHNKESIGSLLRGFFEYFAHQGNHITGGGFTWGLDVLSLRTQGGILSKQVKGWVAAKTEITEPTMPGQDVKEIRQRYLFAIEDPFELEHNIARTVVHHGIVAIRDEFRRAFAIIQ